MSSRIRKIKKREERKGGGDGTIEDASRCENGTELLINGKYYHLTSARNPSVYNEISLAKKYLYKGIYRNTANNGEEIVVSVF